MQCLAEHAGADSPRTPDENQVAQLARSFAPRLAEKLGLQLTHEALDTAIHLSRQYLGDTQMPGVLLDLLKLAGRRTAAGSGTLLRREELLATLSQLTGMPAQVLDDRERVDLTALRSFFAQRVIGQPAAITALVERIAMFKAGLTDPERPIGVFLFAGPTGTATHTGRARGACRVTRPHPPRASSTVQRRAAR